MFHNLFSLFIEIYNFSVAIYFAHKTTDWEINQTISDPCGIQGR